MMKNDEPEAFGDEEMRSYVENSSGSERVLIEIDGKHGDSGISSASADINDQAKEAEERYLQILAVQKYADKKIRIGALKHELTPHKTIKMNRDGGYFPEKEKTMTAEQIFLRGALEIYIAENGRSATLHEFIVFLKEAIRTSIDQDEQGQYSKACFTILARFAGKNFAYQSEDYLEANEEERSAIKSSTRRAIGRVIAYLLNPDDESDTTPPSSPAPPQS